MKGKRTILDWSDEESATVDALKDKFGCGSRSGLFKLSIRLLERVAKKTDEGYELVMRKDGVETIVIFF